jgi:hypothetical protein
MTTMKIGIRISFGTIPRMSEMTTFEPVRTKITQKPMTMPFTALVVTAREGQSPRVITKSGFSLQSPFVNSLARGVSAMGKSPSTGGF